MCESTASIHAVVIGHHRSHDGRECSCLRMRSKGFSIKGSCCWGNEGFPSCFDCGGSGGRWGKGSESLRRGDRRWTRRRVLFHCGMDRHDCGRGESVTVAVGTKKDHCCRHFRVEIRPGCRAGRGSSDGKFDRGCSRGRVL